jgi:indoleamine 2,3-dioxygenase
MLNSHSAGFKPFMEYAGSYALFNYRLEDPYAGLEYSNLRLIRAFERGLDPSSSEAGFVLVHIAMVRHSGELVQGAVNVLEGASTRKRDIFDQGLQNVVQALEQVNAVMNSELVNISEQDICVADKIPAMWTKSKPGSYTSFRTFIFGITSQSMFPNGVVYEGISEKPMCFRGESGANDSMVSKYALFFQF